MVGELQAGELEEILPADTFNPVTHTLVLAGVGGIGVNDGADRVGQRRPARGLVGDVGHNDLGELGHAKAVGDLATNHDGDAVAFVVSDGQGRAHGVAVAAVHAAFLLDGHGFGGAALDAELDFLGENVLRSQLGVLLRDKDGGHMPVGIREADLGFALFRDAHAGVDHIDLFGLKCRNDAVPGHGLMSDGDAHGFGDPVKGINVKAGRLARFFVDVGERRVVGVNAVDVRLLSKGLTGKSQDRQQDQSEKLFHGEIPCYKRMSGDSLQKIKEYRVRNIRTAQRAQGKRRMRVFQKPDTDLYPGSMEAKACLTIHGPVTHCSALCWASWVCACGVSRSSAGGMPDSRSFPAGRRSHGLTKKFPSLSLVRGGMGESSGGAELRPTGKQRSPRRVTESGVTGVAERKTVFSDRLSENTNDAGQSRQNGACRKEKSCLLPAFH